MNARWLCFLHVGFKTWFYAALLILEGGADNHLYWCHKLLKREEFFGFVLFFGFVFFWFARVSVRGTGLSSFRSRKCFPFQWLSGFGGFSGSWVKLQCRSK